MNFDGYGQSEQDKRVDVAIGEHCERHSISALNAVKLWPTLVRRQWLKRFLAHHELFLRTLDVPGDIAELGVFHGHDLFTWANLLECYCLGDRTKTVWGFDNFTGFTRISEQDSASKQAGDFNPGPNTLAELQSAIKIFDSDRFIPQKPRIKLVVGNLEQTLPKFLDEHPGVMFSLLHFDCDLYEPTRIALECLYPRLSVGGLAIFDEYNIPDWPGETRAVNEYFGGSVKIQKFPWTNAPAGYVVKR